MSLIIMVQINLSVCLSANQHPNAQSRKKSLKNKTKMCRPCLLIIKPCYFHYRIQIISHVLAACFAFRAVHFIPTNQRGQNSSHMGAVRKFVRPPSVRVDNLETTIQVTLSQIICSHHSIHDKQDLYLINNMAHFCGKYQVCQLTLRH